MAGALTSWVPAEGVPRERSERYEIDIYAKSARIIGRIYLSNQMIQLHANHTLAVNANAQASYRDAVYYAGECLKLSECLGAEQDEYKAYLKRNTALIFAKAGSFEHAGKLIEGSKKFTDRISGHSTAETWMREAEILMLQGGLKRAERAILNVPTAKSELRPNQYVMQLRIRAIYECLCGLYSRGLQTYENALDIAERLSLGHQAAKIRYGMTYFDRGTVRKLNLSRLRKGTTTNNLSNEIERLF
jgi:hypothetical protein